MKIGVYKITSPSGRVYIGQSWDIERRFNQYRTLHKSCKSQKGLWNSLIKYTPKAHIFETIYTYIYIPTQEDLDRKERKYWQLHKNCYIKLLNIREPGRGGKMSEESKELIRRAITGRKQSTEERAKHCGENNGMYGKKGELAPFFGKHQTKENKELNRQRMKGKRLSARKVIDITTGKVYEAIKDAAIDLGISYDTAKLLVRNKLKNRIHNLIYYEDRYNNSSN